MMPTDKVYLVGFMGSGKTTVGHELAERLRWDLADLDMLIERQEGKPINRIFREKGENYFRQLEAEVLQELLPRRTLVVATGGGAFVQKPNRELMLRDGLVVWPYVPFEVCMKRLSNRSETEKRPLLIERSKKEILQLFDGRRSAYQNAPIIINGVGKPREVAENIIRERKKHF